MTPEYTPINLKFAGEYKKLLCQCGSRASDYSFGNVFGWAEHYGLLWRFDGRLCWIRQTRPETICWAPLGDWKNFDWANWQVPAEGLTFIRVPEELANLWQEKMPDRVEVLETRGQWDYLHEVGDLAELSGNRFHKKKNLVNQYRKSYEIHYSPLTSDCVESVLEMQAEWTKWREIEESPSLLAENKAICRVLELWDSIPGLLGGALRVEGEVVAYTVGEAVCPDTMVIHFEKGMPAYKGVYQTINQCFAREVAETGQLKFINREQDMDDEGLRKAKESYHPVSYVKKNRVKILAK